MAHDTEHKDPRRLLEEIFDLLDDGLNPMTGFLSEDDPDASVEDLRSDLQEQRKVFERILDLAFQVYTKLGYKRDAHRQKGEGAGPHGPA